MDKKMDKFPARIEISYRLLSMWQWDVLQHFVVLIVLFSYFLWRNLELHWVCGF